MAGRTHDNTHPYSDAITASNHRLCPAPSAADSASASCALAPQRVQNRPGAGVRSGPGASTVIVRTRIRRQDAALVRRRVEACAAELKLRCATARVISAVLELLLDWNRVRDDRVRLHHIAARFPAGTRVVTATTIGRLLAKLDAMALIVYRPALGRGTFAEIAIHPRFLDGVAEVRCRGRQHATARRKADSAPQIINFPAGGFLIGDLSPSTPLPPVENGPVDDHLDPRPVEVAVHGGAVAEILAKLPDLYRNAPGRVRWVIGAEVKRYLARGWRADQILSVLAAPMPANAARPLRLAQWRLSHNMIGAGPLLAPLQRRWEAARARAAQSRFTSTLDAAYRDVVAVVGPELEDRMLSAVRSGVHASTRAPERHRAVVHAARMARRDRPGVNLHDAVSAWLSARDRQTARQVDQALPASTTIAPDDGGQLWSVGVLHALTPAGRCVRCNGLDAMLRPELPLPTPVCDPCWQACQEDSPASREMDCRGSDFGVSDVDSRPAC